MLFRQLTLPFVCLVSILTPLFAAEPVPAEKRFPKTTHVFFSIRNVPELSRKWSESQTGRLLNDPALAEFRKGIGETLADQAKHFEDRAGLTLADLLALPQGDLSLGLVSARGKLSLVAVLDYGQHEDQLKKLLVTAAGEIAKSGQPAEEEFEGSKLTVFKFDNPPERSEPRRRTPSNGFDAIVWCLKDDHLILGSSVDGVKSVLRFWSGEQPDSLADNEVYKYIATKCRGEGDPEIKWFANPLGIVNSTATMAGAAGIVIVGSIATVGLDKLKGVGGSVSFGDGEFDSAARTLIYMDKPRSGVLNALDFPAVDLTPPQWVSAEAASYQALSWNVEKAYAAVEKLYDQFSGKGAFAKFVDGQSEQNETAKLHYKRDIVDHLAGRVHVISLPSKPGNAGVAAPTLFIVQLKDQAAFESSLAKVTGHPDFPGKKRDFQGTVIYESESGPATFSLAVARKQLFVSSDAALLEQALKEMGGQPLSDSATWKAVTKHFPAETSYLSYTRGDAQIRSLLESLKNTPADLSTLPLDSLPSAEAIEKYFTPGGTCMVPDEKGLYFLSFSLKARVD